MKKSVLSILYDFH